LKAEGVFFENIYASGDRTDKGLAAVLSGYPALPSSSIIRTPAKSAQLNLLSTLLNKAGYKSSFYYGGETEFANIKSYLIQGGFDPIIDKNQFSKKDQNSKWGVHDGIVAQQILKNTRQLQQPFFLTWLTLSSHEPYEIPEPALINSNNNTAKFLSSIHYTDKSLYQFLQQSKLQSWWANTLIIIIGDHGHPLPETGNQVDNFKIPMLWLGGALRQQNIIIDKVASQTDLASTLAKQLGQNASYFPYSRDIMKSNADEWALFRFNDGFGWVKPDGYLIYDNIGKQIVKQEGKMDRQNIIIGQALQQVYYEDFLKR
jgi:phosphoglycerol transferase MdoB-like AlkP superfamily enzyme